MYRFSTSLPYLLARLGVRMGELFARELAWDGLTLPMYRVLAVLTEAGAAQRLGELSELTSIETSTMSRLVAEMQRRGLVTRERPENDQRSLAVGLTPVGAALAARLIPRAAHYEKVVMGDLPPKRVAQLKAELTQIYSRLDLLDEELSEAEEARASPAPRLASGRTRN